MIKWLQYRLPCTDQVVKQKGFKPLNEPTVIYDKLFAGNKAQWKFIQIYSKYILKNGIRMCCLQNIDFFIEASTRAMGLIMNSYCFQPEVFYDFGVLLNGKRVLQCLSFKIHFNKLHSKELSNNYQKLCWVLSIWYIYILDLWKDEPPNL